MRLIDADALLAEYDRVHVGPPGGARKLMEDAPSVEARRGKWLPDNRPGGGFWVCSCCKFPSEAFAADVLYKFCPNCGADMRGEEE